MAEQICVGFQAHDQRNRDAAIDAFHEVDTLQFAHLDSESARRASVAYVDALWAKDEVEHPYTDGTTIDCDGLDRADWSSVESHFQRRAAIVGMNPAYAELSTRAWKNHKTGGDYWTPIQRAQMYELRAALQDRAYPHKPRYGQSGFGAEASRYALAVELHDMRTSHHWEQAKNIMIPYFTRILQSNDHF